jgi:hypothetical protein
MLKDKKLQFKSYAMSLNNYKSFSVKPGISIHSSFPSAIELTGGKNI